MEMTRNDIEAIKKALSDIHFFQHLQPVEMDSLLKGFEKAEIVKGESLITQGKTGEIFYILASGKVGVYLKQKLVDKHLVTLGPGSFFGEMSLISDEPRSASVVCEEPGIVFTLLRRTFRDVLMSNPAIGQLIRETASKRKSETHTIELSEAMGRSLR